MKTFRKFLESCEQINEAEYNKEWWDSKSDSYKKRYIERHPNSIYAQKAQTSKTTVKERTPEHIDKEIEAITSTLGSLMKEPGGARDDVIEGLTSKLSELQREKAAKTQNEKKPFTSIKATKDLVQNKNSTSDDFEKAATVLLDKPQQTDSWMRKVTAFAEHPYTPESVIRRMEKEQPYAALHSPKASQEFLDSQIKTLNPYDAYTWMDALVQNPSLDTSQRETLSIKLKKALNDVNKKKWAKDSKDFYKERLQWQLDQLLNK